MSEKSKTKTPPISPLRKWWSVVLGLWMIIFMIITTYWSFISTNNVIMPVFLFHVDSNGLIALLIGLVALIMTTFALFDIQVSRSSHFRTRIIRMAIPLILFFTVGFNFLGVFVTDAPAFRYIGTTGYGGTTFIMLVELNPGVSKVLMYKCDVTGTLCTISFDESYDAYFDNSITNLLRAEKVELIIQSDGPLIIVRVDSSVWRRYSAYTGEIHNTD